MPGTSYAGTTEYRYKNPPGDDVVIIPSNEATRQSVGESGRWAVQHRSGTEFEVTLDESLTSTTDGSQIADRLNRYYAAELVRRGWHMTGFSIGGGDPQRYWRSYVWSDLGHADAQSEPNQISVGYTETSDDRNIRCDMALASARSPVDQPPRVGSTTCGFPFGWAAVHRVSPVLLAPSVAEWAVRSHPNAPMSQE